MEVGNWMSQSGRKLCKAVAVATLCSLLPAIGLTGGRPSSEVDACLRAAAQRHSVPYVVLRAIAEVESGFNPAAVRKPFAAGGDSTWDYGLMQINSGWLPTLARWGIEKRHLFHPCVSADVGAWILSDNIRRLGYSWDAVGAYNAKTPWKRARYANKVYAKLVAHTRGDRSTQVVVAAASGASPRQIGAWETGGADVSR